MKKITTEYVNPSIPSRAYDWCAYYPDDMPDSQTGWGATEQEAINDLKEQDDE